MSKKCVFKYPLEIADEQFVRLPLGYSILTVQAQLDKPTMWVLIDSNQKTMIDVKVLMFGTGYLIPDENALIYHGSCQLCGGGLVYHVFTEDSPF